MYFLLHASCVVYKGKTLILAGKSGYGKTTIAYKLLKSGAKFVADDPVIFSLKTAEILPSPSTIRLRLYSCGVNHFVYRRISPSRFGRPTHEYSFCFLNSPFNFNNSLHSELKHKKQITRSDGIFYLLKNCANIDEIVKCNLKPFLKKLCSKSSFFLYE